VGYQTLGAPNGRAGLELAKKTPPSLIITDWMMPDLSGPELIEELRADGVLAGIPVVLLTAKSDEESKVAGKEKGADAFLAKPFNAQELTSTVRNLIQLKSHEEKLRVTLEELKETSEKELRHAKNLLTQSEKLAQLGEMVASIGHEIDNPLMLVSMAVQSGGVTANKLEESLMVLFTGSEDAEKAGQYFQVLIDDLRKVNETASTGAKRLKELSMALRTQSRMEQEATPGVELNDVVKESMLIAGGRTKVHHVAESLGELRSITCYRSKIGQVVTNLLANAADALTEKVNRSKENDGARFEGRISVTSASKDREGKPGVLVAVSDNGDGVPEAIRERIFEQFFTTKPAGVGTGLGLAMCVDIVKEHGGMLSVTDDETLGGARFELWLPVGDGSRLSSG
jgi:signal transduction histidine kinase